MRLLRAALMLLGLLALAGAHAATAEPFNVATYNLRLNLASDGPNAWPQRREAVKALVRYHGFDIFGTQEGLPEQIRDLEAMAEFARVGVGRDDGRAAGEHAAIFFRRERFERLDGGDFWLSPTPGQPSMGWDARCCKRIATWVKLADRQSGQRFFVFNAHFDHEGVVARRESALLVLRKIAEIAGDAPVICMGDLNSTPGSDAVRSLSAALRDSRDASETPPYGPLGTFNDFKLDAPLRERIDYVFVNAPWRVLKYGVLSDNLERRYPSDHHPVAVRLQLDTRAAGTAVAAGTPVAAWLTTGDRQRLLAPVPVPAFGTAPAAVVDVAVDPAQRFQTMAGFGASITDASAWLLQHRMSEAQRNALLQELFGRGPGGVGFDFVRLTIGASDFSRSHYSLNDRPPGQTDMALAGFSIDANRADVLPVVRRALAINPGLQVMASPWSAPAWMKTTDSLIQGTLKPGMEDVFSRYLVRYVEAYAAEGVPIFALTLQNEPHFEPKDYPGMRLDPAQRARIIGGHLGPLLARRGLRVQLIDWDHNWDEPQSPMAVLADPVARPYVAGVAWHCYAGNVQVQTAVHEAFPDKDTWFTECSGGEWKTDWAETLPWMVRHLVIGSTRGWARGVLMWNLALDEQFGPHLGGCKDCRGVVTIDSRTGQVTRNLEYYALAHASRFVRPGAQRIASTAAVAGLQTVAFRNADDGSLVLVVCNSAAAEQPMSVTQGGRSFNTTMPRESVATFVWTPR